MLEKTQKILTLSVMLMFSSCATKVIKNDTVMIEKLPVEMDRVTFMRAFPNAKRIELSSGDVTNYVGSSSGWRGQERFSLIDGYIITANVRYRSSPREISAKSISSSGKDLLSRIRIDNLSENRSN